MSDLDKEINYVFNLVDNVSSTAGQMQQSLESTSEGIVELENRQEGLQATTQETIQQSEHMRLEVRQDAEEAQASLQGVDASLQRTQMNVLTQLTALMGFREAISAVTSGLIGMGLVGDDTAEALMKVNSAFSLFAGAVTTIKSVQAVMTTLNAATAIQGALETFIAVIKNPMYAAVVGVAAGAAVGALGAYALMSGGSTTNNSSVTINVTDTTPQQAQSEIYQVVSGGALRW